MTKPKEFTPNAINAADFNPGESLTILIYGDTKSGKTFFEGSFGPRTVFINIGSGMSTLYSPVAVAKYGKPAFTIVNITEDFDNPKMFDEVSDSIDYYYEHHLNDFDSIVVDDASALNDSAMNKGMVLGDQTGRSKAFDISRKFGVNIAGRQDFGAQMSLMDQFCKYYTEQAKTNGKNFILSAHAKSEFAGEGEKRTIKRIRPLFTGNNKIASYFDLVWYMQAVGNGDKKVYRAVTQGDEVTEAGSRWGGLFPETYRNPNYPEILNALHTMTPVKQK